MKAISNKKMSMLKETAGCFSQKHISVMIRIPITEVDAMETKDVILETGGVPMGEWRNSSKHGNIETFVKGI